MAVDIKSNLESNLENILKNYKSAELTKINTGELCVVCGSGEIFDLLKTLKTSRQLYFDHLGCLTAIDWPDKIEIVYQLASYSKKHKLIVKTHTERKNPKVPSVVSIWSSANWLEREVFDFYGVVFEGHPNMKRLFTSDDFPGHQFRKDFPLGNREDYVLRDKNRLII